MNGENNALCLDLEKTKAFYNTIRMEDLCNCEGAGITVPTCARPFR